jgi:high mobility group protein B1
MKNGTNNPTVHRTLPGTNDSFNEPFVLEATRNARNHSSKSKKRPTVDEPTRAPSAFELFGQAECDRIKADHPNATSAEIFQQIGETWRNANSDTKVQYVAKFVALHTKNQADANQATTPKTPKTPKARKTTDPNEPKRACSTFMLFSQVERVRIKAANPGATRAEMFQLLGEKWQAADADTKAEYVTLYAANKVNADAARKAYADSPTPTAPKIKNTDPNAPKRACSTFMLFSHVERARVRAEHPCATRAEIVKRLGATWRAADADTKAKYAALYAENKVKADGARRAYADANAS